MDIKRAKDKKHRLEAQIEKLVVAFERQTKLSVKDMRISRYMADGDPDYEPGESVFDIELEVGL